MILHIVRGLVTVGIVMGVMFVWALILCVIAGSDRREGDDNV